MRAVCQLSLDDKLRIVEEYRSNKGPLNEFARKYRISHTAIWSWNRIFAPEKRPSRKIASLSCLHKEMFVLLLPK